MATTAPNLSVLDAVYDLDVDDEVWLRSIAAAVEREMDVGVGQFCCTVNFADPSAYLSEMVVTADSDRLEDLGFALTGSCPDKIRHRLWSAPYCTPLSRLVAGQSEDLFQNWFLEVFGSLKIRDSLGIGAIDHSGYGFVAFNVVRHLIDLPVTIAVDWQRVVVHILAAMRLRRSLLNDNEAGAPEAVIEPTGSVLHAEGEARQLEVREALAQAVQNREMARANSRRGRQTPSVDVESSEGLDLWQGLVLGTWSLVDWVEGSGRRIVLARRNLAAPRTHRALTVREEQVAKLAAAGHAYKTIAYELGLARTTVSTLLGRALRKLGVRDRSSWVRLAPALLSPEHCEKASSSPDQTPNDTQASGHSPKPGALAAQFQTGLQCCAVQSRTSGSQIALRCLSESERDVVLAAAAGHSNADIARHRNRSVRTVANQLASAFRKLRVGSRFELAACLGLEPTSAVEV